MWEIYHMANARSSVKINLLQVIIQYSSICYVHYRVLNDALRIKLKRSYNISGPPILAARRDQVFRRLKVLPLLRLHADLHRGVRETLARLPERVRACARGMRTAYAQIRLPMARAHGVREVAEDGRCRPSLHGGARPRART